MKRIGLVCLTIMLLSSTACMHRNTHQGNVFEEGEVWQIQEGDTKFHVESILGSPAIKDLLHPNRVQYVEQVKENSPDAAYIRGVIIDYDNALRVKHITRFGFQE